MLPQAKVPVRHQRAEAVHLDDGTPLRLRPVTPIDKSRFRRAFTRLSRLSRYYRFHGHKQDLSEADLSFLTGSDGHRHFALVVLEADAAGGEGELVGVARYVRLDDDPESCEVAVTVVDAWQKRGVGRLLLERLIGEARRRGIRRIRVRVLAENVGMRALLKDLFGAHRLEREDEAFVGDFPIAGAGTGPARTGALFALLRLAAAGAVLPLHFALDFSRSRLDSMRRRIFSQAPRKGTGKD